MIALCLLALLFAYWRYILRRNRVASNDPVNEYGCRVLNATERSDVYEQRRGKGDLERIARGIKTKRRMIQEFRNIDARKARQAGTQVRRQVLRLAR